MRDFGSKLPGRNIINQQKWGENQLIHKQIYVKTLKLSYPKTLKPKVLANYYYIIKMYFQCLLISANINIQM